MSVFKNYSKYYNLLYKDKDYKKEADYVNTLIGTYSKGSKTILNLGCGTGSHDYLFSDMGYSVVGVDLSEDMIEMANNKKTNATGPEFLHGDIRNVVLQKTFDTVLSLFHVMSYQTSNKDLDQAIKTAHKHLEKDGLFIFDCWYGPGVLTDRPALRNRELEDENYLVKRLSTPQMYPNENCVDVKFDVTIFDKKNKEEFQLQEVHKMRYLFLPEIELFLNENGFDLLKSEEWLSGKELTFTSWNATFVAKKK